ncbi:hypothetical protein EDEG_01062 [Edhazardia aedis USNM 41457]|uniref:Uncharacterized protein n=1 Tax=Edhazardia aedis (strain USNM 41457) TaxID=1003232 RepID=J9DTZ9_EDHAE|nr:hypothetical protein EDEG_01062 [Edhazardia aedis USNM 41457]|eukprot:EJW04772.1 hypothetical protein EDEG_01062 [Edhazardia aedis USNM 41457]
MRILLLASYLVILKTAHDEMSDKNKFLRVSQTKLILENELQDKNQLKEIEKKLFKVCKDLSEAYISYTSDFPIYDTKKLENAELVSKCIELLHEFITKINLINLDIVEMFKKTQELIKITVESFNIKNDEIYVTSMNDRLNIAESFGTLASFDENLIQIYLIENQKEIDPKKYGTKVELCNVALKILKQINIVYKIIVEASVDGQKCLNEFENILMKYKLSLGID